MILLAVAIVAGALLLPAPYLHHLHHRTHARAFTPAAAPPAPTRMGPRVTVGLAPAQAPSPVRPEGTLWVASAAKNGVRVIEWDVASEQPLRHAVVRDTKPIHALFLASTGEGPVLLASDGTAAELVFLDVDLGERARLDLGGGDRWSIAADPRRVAVAHGQRVEVVDAKTASRTNATTLDDEVRGIAADGDALVAIGGAPEAPDVLLEIALPSLVVGKRRVLSLPKGSRGHAWYTTVATSRGGVFLQEADRQLAVIVPRDGGDPTTFVSAWPIPAMSDKLTLPRADWSVVLGSKGPVVVRAHLHESTRCETLALARALVEACPSDNAAQPAPHVGKVAVFPAETPKN